MGKKIDGGQTPEELFKIADEERRKNNRRA